MDSRALQEWDKHYIWHPFTQMKDWLQEEPLVIERGEGSYLYDTSGRRYIDGVSSLWVLVHGHGKKELIDALKEQAVAKWEKHGQIPKGADRMLRLIYLEHLNGNVPIVATISRINNTDHQNHERIIADSASGLWKLAA